MVKRYNSSLSVPTAEVAKPRDTGLAELGGAVRDFAKTAAAEATRKMEERNLSLESAAINEARIQLAKRGGELALELQADRIAGSNYVPDLEKARAALKDEIWAGIPSRIQNSQRAKLAWDDIWTSDQIAATRAAVGWQQGEEKNFAVNSLNNAVLAMSAAVEADPTSVTRQLEGWNQSVPTYGGLLDQNTLEDAKLKGVQALTQGAVRGYAKRGQFDEATKLIADMSAQLTPEQRNQFAAVIEDAERDIEQERLRQEAETAKAQRAAGNVMEVSILDGRGSRQAIDAGVASGAISVNDQPALIRALREEQERRKREAEAATKDSPELAEYKKNLSADMALGFEWLSRDNPALFMGDRDKWPEEFQLAYANMTPADQRKVESQRVEMRQTGSTSNAVDAVAQDIMNEARRLAPSLMATGEGNADVRFLFEGILYGNARKLSVDQGGKALTPEQARKVVLQSLAQYDTKKYGAGVGVALENMDIQAMRSADPDMWMRTSSVLQRKLGRVPTAREVAAEINRIDELDNRGRAFVSAMGG